ncbi:MAG: ATP-binding cassette domain-containing protein [Candidatus Nealsonbacteria bacterium]|nr:ATP-binding cassette domain-containing protein [Candidatus Nealsonbacteria bacterium]
MIISFKGVTKIYNSLSGPIKAIDNVSFDIERGEFVSLVGRSGAGKTTLLKIILGQEKPNLGDVFFNGEDVRTIKSSHLPLLRRRIGAVFQDYKLLQTKTALENIVFVLQALGIGDDQIEKDAAEVLNIVELSHRNNNFPAELSGGEKQRLALARALVSRPEVLLADEPTGNLDPYHTQDIIRLLQKVHQIGTTVILATHNREIINNLNQRVITLEEGRIIRDEKEGKFII